MKWEAAEEISVLCGGESAKFVSTNTELCRQTEFVGKINRSKPLVYAVYPYSTSVKMEADGVLVFDLPSDQVSDSASFSSGQFPCVAMTDDNNLHFKNVCGGARFIFSRDDIESIEFSANNQSILLSGAAKVKMDGDGSPVFVSVTGGSNTITLKPSSAKILKVSDNLGHIQIDVGFFARLRYMLSVEGLQRKRGSSPHARQTVYWGSVILIFLPQYPVFDIIDAVKFHFLKNSG